jgi:hypothetical protein
MAPHPAGDGTYVVMSIFKTDTQVPLIEDEADSGKWVAVILAHPDKYEGKIFSDATRLYSMSEVAQKMSKVTGKTVNTNNCPMRFSAISYRRIFDVEAFQMTEYIRDFGYFSPQMKELVEWPAQQARGKLTTLE